LLRRKEQGKQIRMLKLILSFLLIFFALFGCSRKQKDLEQPPDSSSPELTLPQIPKLPPLYKPTNKDMQIALKNAGFYKGEIDGDIGPMTERAIREFQAENDLIVDGVVGPKTWAALSKYLTSQGEKDVPQF